MDDQFGHVTKPVASRGKVGGKQLLLTTNEETRFEPAGLEEDITPYYRGAREKAQERRARHTRLARQRAARSSSQMPSSRFSGPTSTRAVTTARRGNASNRSAARRREPDSHHVSSSHKAT